MRKHTYTYIFSLILATFAMVYCVYLNYPPLPLLHIRINKLLNAAYSDGKLLILDKAGGRIFIVNEDKKVIFVCKTSKLAEAPERIADVALDNNFFYLVGNDTKDGGLYCLREHVEQYDLRGRHLRTVYVRSIPEEEQAVDKSIVSCDTYKGKLYVSMILPSGYRASVLCFNDNGTGSEVCNVECGFKIQYAYYYPGNNKLSIVDTFNRSYVAEGNSTPQHADIAEFFGNTDTMNAVISAVVRKENISVLLLAQSWCWPLYEKDGSCHLYAYARELSDSVSLCDVSKDNSVKIAKIEKIQCSAAIVFFGFINFTVVVWLLLSVIYGIWWFLKKGKPNQRKNLLYLFATFFVTVGVILYYSYNIRNIMTEQYKAKARALSHVAIHDIGYIMPDFMEHLRLHGVKGYLINPKHQKSSETTINHFNNLCADCGEQDRFYIRLMICDSNNCIVNCIDTTKDYPCGYNFTIDEWTHAMEAISRDNWEKKITPHGEAVAFFRPIYDENNVLAGIVETGYYTENLYKLAFKKSLLLFICMCTILFYLIPVLFFVFRKKSRDDEG